MDLIDDAFVHNSITPEQMDMLLEDGWRHFGTYFFRYSVAVHSDAAYTVIPLRIDLDKFAPSHSQKRVLAKNKDVRVMLRDTFIDDAKHELFYKHRERFHTNIPDSVYDFVSDMPASVPCLNHELCIFKNDELLGVSFLDVGRHSTSAVYAMFNPDESRRSLGVFMMLEAIRYSKEKGFRYYYPGYAYRESSIYDYKKNFQGLEYLNWESGWRSYTA